MKLTNTTDISADVANSSTNINVILVSVMYFTDVLILKIWPILANTDTNVNIGASLIHTMAYSIILASIYITIDL